MRYDVFEAALDLGHFGGWNASQIFSLNDRHTQLTGNECSPVAAQFVGPGIRLRLSQQWTNQVIKGTGRERRFGGGLRRGFRCSLLCCHCTDLPRNEKGTPGKSVRNQISCFEVLRGPRQYSREDKLQTDKKLRGQAPFLT